jgi:hypothetical protein
MVPGLGSVEITTTGSVVTELCPQPLIALTVTLPPALLAVVVILFVVLVPVHPEGKVQI